jgi:hypothetical protein
MNRRAIGLLALTLLVGLGLFAEVGSGAVANGDPGSQGTDVALPDTESKVTVRGRGEFSDLAITVNQTKNLVSQAVSITWTGGTPTLAGPSRFAQHYLQIMQCWGDPDGSVPDNPGPPPEQCVFGGVTGVPQGIPGGVFPPGSATTERILATTRWPNYETDFKTVGWTDPETGLVWRPFRAVNGEEVPRLKSPSYSPSVEGSVFWLNKFFDFVKTNEIVAAQTTPDGSGSELFQVDDGARSGGLGCGLSVQAQPDGSRKVPRCWIVIVPRGSALAENVGTPDEGSTTVGVNTSPLAPRPWSNRIAIEIEFNPLDSPCDIRKPQRRMSGSELAVPAVVSWQPVLCSGGELPPYGFGAISDAQARLQLTNGTIGMAVVSRPINPSTVDPANPLVYAPLTLSGLAIGLNYERQARIDTPPDVLEDLRLIEGVRVADINLTPRLVAKLLTQSYGQAVSIYERPDYEWLQANPEHLADDPDFLRFNPEFELLQPGRRRTFASLQIPIGNSDAARQVWEWILADDEAKRWLDGEADEWDMKVNPEFSTNAEVNPSGVGFGDTPPTGFPKLDRFCFQAAENPATGVTPPPLCTLDWTPYAQNLDETAERVRLGNDAPRIVENPFAAVPNEVWVREAAQPIGERSLAALTDLVSAQRYGLQVARLSRADDNGPDREFVPATSETVTAALAAMTPGVEPRVLEPTPTPPPGAYPLSTLTYAVTSPLRLDDDARREYAAFVSYAAGAGQEPGLELGQLPLGYVPLTPALREQATEAAEQILTLQPPPPPESTTTTTVAPVPTTTPTSGSASAPIVRPTTPSSSGRPASGGSGSSSSRAPTATPTPVTSVPPAPETSAAPVDTAPTSAPATSVPDEGLAPPPSTLPPTTPGQSAGVTRFAVPMLGGVALLSALGALELTKRPRRRRGVEVLTTEALP